MNNESYNGYKNYETWNVALWLNNDLVLYGSMLQFKGYKSPYLSLIFHHNGKRAPTTT